MNKKFWTDEETNLFLERFPMLSNFELSQLFGRSIPSIQKKAHRMGIYKDAETIFRVWSKVKSGDKGSNWKGGRKTNRKGHVLILKKEHPMSEKCGYVLEHRLVMAEALGRYLQPCEIVHHINGIKTDNRIENLQVMTNAEHTKLHHIGSKRSEETKLKLAEARRRRI